MSVSFSPDAREASGENVDLQQICQVKKDVLRLTCRWLENEDGTNI